jgi:transposase
MNKKYIVKLTSQERKMLGELVHKGKNPAYKIKHAHILLQADQRRRGWKDERIAQSLGCHLNTVRNVRERFVKEGLEMALERKKQETPSRLKLLDGKKEAHLIALGCSQPPKGFARWTLQLLADKLVSLEMVESISLETVRQTLKKTNLSLI